MFSGIAGAPVFQQRMMDTLPAGMKRNCAFAYLDDIVIYSKTFEKHLIHLESLFKKSSKGNLQLNRVNLTLCKAEITYLRSIIHEKGISLTL